MLRTLVRQIAPEMFVSVHEPTNQQYYDMKTVVRRLVGESDDEVIRELKGRFSLVVFRTSTATGFDLDSMVPSPSSTDDQLNDCFKLFMELSFDATQNWALAVIEATKPVPTVIVGESEVPDPK